LRHAHTAQQTLVLDLQETVRKSQQLKKIILNQETVISQLESQLEQLKKQESKKISSNNSLDAIPQTKMGSIDSINKVGRESLVQPVRFHPDTSTNKSPDTSNTSLIESFEEKSRQLIAENQRLLLQIETLQNAPPSVTVIPSHQDSSQIWTILKKENDALKEQLRNKPEPKPITVY
jgi:hypothetical protein